MLELHTVNEWRLFVALAVAVLFLCVHGFIAWNAQRRLEDDLRDIRDALDAEEHADEWRDPRRVLDATRTAYVLASDALAEPHAGGEQYIALLAYHERRWCAGDRR